MSVVHPFRETVRAARAAAQAAVSVNGWLVRARRFGDDSAPPLVMVHGLGISSIYLVPTAIRLAEDFLVWIPDFPGFGDSEKPEHTLDIPEMADVLGGLIEIMDLGPVPLIGNSLGCQIIVDLAVRRPELVSRIVLAGPTVDPAHRSIREQVTRLLVDGQREASSLGLLHVRDYVKARTRRVWRTFKHSLADRIEEKLPLVPHPALVVRGSRDPVVPQEWAEEAARLLPRGELHVIPGAPHAINYSAPVELARVCRSFLLENGHG